MVDIILYVMFNIRDVSGLGSTTDAQVLLHWYVIYFWPIFLILKKWK
jgi:hypothetical protein